MNLNLHSKISSKFDRIGVKAIIQSLENVPANVKTPMTIDVHRTRATECYDIRVTGDVRLEVLDSQVPQRHLLLSAKNWLGEDRFLCGHDEFHWFVAAIPHDPGIRTVSEAKDALKPTLVTRIEGRRQRGKHWRRSDVFFRQGEWFFIPWPHVQVDPQKIEEHSFLLRNLESQAHRCEFKYRHGEREYGCDRYPKLAFFESEYQEILRTRRKAKQWKWRELPFYPETYVKGWVTHPDHSPLHLDDWCRVQQNQETTQRMMSRLVYRD